MRHLNGLVFIFVLFISLELKGQKTVYQDNVFLPEIKTIQLYNTAAEQSFPILTLNSDEQLLLAFDDLTGQNKNLFYTIEPCNPDWTSAGLQQFEFMDGYLENRITNYFSSHSTLQAYLHYELTFPHENLKPTISGNYILKVYQDNDTEQLVLTRKFLIVEPIVGVTATVTRSPIVDDMEHKQKVNFNILIPPDYTISDPFLDVNVVVLQNDRWDNMKFNDKPLFIRDHILIYEQTDANIFDASNEFRRFDMRSLRYQTEHIASIKKDSLNKVILTLDLPHTFNRYVSINDLNGRYYPRIQEYNNPSVEADYAWVEFSLPYSPVFNTGDVFLSGKFTDWNFASIYKMNYDYTNKYYKGLVYLKQGVYDYQYVLMEKGAIEPDCGILEGNRFEAENNYSVLVYHKPIASKYFHLIGYTRINSNGSYR